MAELPNLSNEKNAMPVQDPKKRAHNFEEVALGMSMITAQADTVLIIKADGNIDEAKSTAFLGSP